MKDPLIAPNSYARISALSAAETRQLTGALALQKLAKKLIANEEELRRPPTPPAEDEEDNDVKEEKPATKDVVEIKLEPDQDGTHSGTAGRNVLTLFGNAQGPKQLFSSLQRPLNAASALGKRPLSAFEDDVEVALPIRDEFLPNMISTTKILPVKSEESKPKSLGPTLGEIFRAPTNTRDLTPPKSRQSSSRSNTIQWEFSESRPKRRTSYNYTTTNISAGQWLGYRGIDVGPEPTSPEAKRKQRDRALSTGEARPQLSEEAREAVEQAKEDALFRSVYSSFAPSRDDSAAIVSAQTKDMVWWHKVGAQRFTEQFVVDESAIDPALMDVDSVDVAKDDFDDEAIKQAVEQFEPDTEPLSIIKPKKPAAEQDTEEVLDEISDLLETLNSYQRIRNSSLATAGHTRTPSMSQQRETVANLSGSPTSPTTGEVDIYNILKSQLTLLINTLPPFAVAKLNGDRLADLNITKGILVETKDYKGIMQEDHASRAARAAALNAAVGQSQGNRMGSGPGQYNSPAYNRPVGQLGARPNNYFPQQQPPNSRTPIARPGGFSTPGSFQNSQSRPNYSQQQAYNAAVSSTRGPGYSATPLSNFSQSQNKTNNYGQYYQNSPQGQNSNRNYSQQSSSSNFQPRPSSTGPAQQAPMYNSYNGTQQGSASPHVRTASPLKPAPQRPSFSNANAGTPSYGTPNSVNAQARPASSSSYSNGTANNNGPTGFHTSMSNAEQQSLMERQRAQIQQSSTSQSQVKTQGSASPAPGTPQAT